MGLQIISPALEILFPISGGNYAHVDSVLELGAFERAVNMSIIKQKFDPPIPKGWIKFTNTFNIAWLWHHREKLPALFKKDNDEKIIVLRRDRKNPHDKKAIEILIKEKGFFIFNNYTRIGYLPPKLAHFLYKHKLLSAQPRIRKVSFYPVSRDYAYRVYVVVDLICKSSLMNKKKKKQLKKIEEKFGYGDEGE